MANYSSLEEMLNTTENMQHLVVSVVVKLFCNTFG